MKNRTIKRLLSLLLALVMLVSLLTVMAFAEEAEETPAEPAAAAAPEAADDVRADDPAQEPEDPAQPAGEDESETPAITDYSVFLADLKVLESYAAAYAGEHDGEDPVALVINFIRTGVYKYTISEWPTVCGPEQTAFTSFVAEQDAANGTDAMALRSLGVFTLPNGDAVEFGHMFGCMDMSYHTKNRDTADLGSWAGDICDLVQLTTNAGVSGSVEDMVTEIRTNDSLFLFDDPDRHSFGQMDVYADLDAFYILSRLSGANTISQIMENYYTPQLNNSFRAMYFLENRLGGASTRADIRSIVYEIYTSNNAISLLESKYVPEGVNGDLRMACCYTFADYLFDSAQDRLTNPYYTMFSSESSVIAPGVTQEIRLARTADNKQLAYYIATVDVSRDDVQVYANYGSNDASFDQLARVSDQVAAAQARHTNPDDPEHYIENYNAVVGVNADFFNMSTGHASGVLVMEGQHFNDAPKNSSNYFFAILDDGTPVIAQNKNWAQYRDRVQEAVGGGALLVRNGKIDITSTTNYYNDRASRTAVGITYDGRVVLMVLDGRQEPRSCGGSAIEIAQIMLDAGCVMALNLDGGGSSTYVAKQEGSDVATVVNNPSDGFERGVSSSLLVVSTAKPSNVFDHAVVSADYDYLTVGTSLEVRASGVTATGGAIDLPEGSELRLSDDSIGTLSDGTFTASALGDVQVQVVSADGAVLGKKTLHVVVPTGLKFLKDTINVVYGEPETLPVEASYNGNVVKINPNDVVFGFEKISLQSIGSVEGGDVNTTVTSLEFSYPEAGTISGFDFTGNAAGGLRTLRVGAVLASEIEEFQNTISQAANAAYQKAIQDGFSADQARLIAQEAGVKQGLDSAASITIYLYSADEATFDFNNATGGDGLLNWKREVSNSVYRPDENIYYVVDPSEDMVTSYTFAVDMSKMPIPEKLTKLLFMLPGGDQEGRRAWDFLLQLAERISPLTYVTVNINIPEGFTADIENLRLVNEYFTMTSAEVQDGVLTIKANFIEQTEPINPTTANPLCVLSGLKLIPNEDAPWDENGAMQVNITGSLGYEIYAHFHMLENFSKDPANQEEYGLYPYSNREYNPQDYGGYFNSNADKPIEFADSYRLNGSIKDGWVRENGAWKYYDNGEVLTGPQYLGSYDADETGAFWFDLGEDGACKGKYTGFAERNGKWYYPMNGTPTTGWYEIAGENYYFNPDGSAQTGTRTFGVATYEFDDHGKVVRGCWVTTEEGTRYYYAGNSYYHTHGGGTNAWFAEIDGNTYAFRGNGYRYENGYALIRTGADENGDRNFLLYYFDENGVCAGVQDQIVGKVELMDGRIIYAENGLATQHGCYAEYFDADGNQVDTVYEAATAVYYYFGYQKEAVRNTDQKVNLNNDLLPKNQVVHFDENCQYIVDVTSTKYGIYDEDGGRYFYLNGERYAIGLFEYSDGNLYYAYTDGQIQCGKRFMAYKPNTEQTGRPKQLYYADPQGVVFEPEIQLNAVVKRDGTVLRAGCPLEMSYSQITSDLVAPSFVGYKLVGWQIKTVTADKSDLRGIVLTDGIATPSDVNNGVRNGLSHVGYDRTAKVTILALYQKTEDTYRIDLSYTMPDGTVVPNYITDPALVGDAQKITTSETFVDGAKTYYFDHWVIDGKEFGGTSVTVRPSKAGTYSATAVYTEQESAAAVPMLSVTDVYAETINAIAKTNVTLAYSVPEGYALQAVGFRVSTKDPTLQQTFSLTTSSLTTADGSYTVHINVNNKRDTTVYVCAYLIVENTSTGETETILTDPVGYVWSEL